MDIFLSILSPQTLAKMMATTWGADDLQVIQRVPGTEIFPQALGPWLCPLTFMSTEHFYVHREGRGGSADCLVLGLRRVPGSGQPEGGG